MRILDLYCGGGGASMGAYQAGYEVVGVDYREQPEYPFEFVLEDVFEFTKQEGWWERFDCVIASPPCQAYSLASRSWGDIGYREGYPDLVGKTRELLIQSGKPYCIENVESAPLIRNQTIRLCGEMFGLGVIRHRLFETNWELREPEHIPHQRAVRIEGLKHKRSAYCSVAGHGGDSRSYKLKDWQEAMGIDWISNRKTLVEAVPPAYSRYIMTEFLKQR